MQNEQTNETDTQRAKTDKLISEYDKTLSLVQRMEEATKAESENLARKERLVADEQISGESGGHVPTVPAKEETPQEYKDRVMRGEL